MATKSLILAMFVIFMTTQVGTNTGLKQGNQNGQVVTFFDVEGKNKVSSYRVQPFSLWSQTRAQEEHACSYGFISQRLVEYIADKSNPDVIPQTSIDKSVNLKLSMILNNIEDVDQRKNKVEIDAWLNLKWNTGITFDPEDFNNLQKVRFPPSKMWVPDLAVYNGQIELLDYVGHHNAVIEKNGEALWIPPSKIRVSCDVADDKLLTNATCQVKIGSWAYSGQNVYLDEHTYLDISSYSNVSKYNVTNVSAKREMTKYECCPEEYHTIIFTFSFVKK